MAADIVERGRERRRRQPSPPRPHHLAPEAEPAIDRAGIDDFEQHAVGIAVDDAFDRTERIVADRIAALLGLLDKLARVGHELPRDRIVRIAAVDRGGHHRRDRHRIARGDRGELIEPLARHQRRAAKRVNAAQGGRAGLHASGFHKTWSMREAPVASITRRSRPSAMPQACGIAASAARKSSSIG